MRYFVIGLFLLLSGYPSVAQHVFPNIDLAKELRNRTLAIQILDEKTENEKNQNAALKEIFSANWTLTPVEYLNKEDIGEIFKTKNQKYAVLTQWDHLQEDIRTGRIDSQGRMKNIGSGQPGDRGTFKYTAFSFSLYEFNLHLITDKKTKIITSIGFPNGELSRIDYLYLSQQLNHMIKNALDGTPMREYYSVERNIKTFETYTLVLLKDFFKEKQIKDISKNYSYDYKLVDFDEYQDVILNKTPNTGYTKILWSHQHKTYVWVVADSKDGSILSLLSFGGVKLGRHHDANDIIKVKHLSYVYNKMGQNFNNKYK